VIMADDQPLPDLMGYATPNELAMKRLYARQLLGRTQDINDNAPAVSPFAILGGVVNQLAGQRILGEAAQQDRMRQVGSVAGAPIAGGEDDNTPAFGGDGPLSMKPPGPSSANDPISRYAAANSSQESGGNYSAIGPAVKDPRTGQIDHAYGIHQVMGKNIPAWTQEILGTPLTPQQFLQNPKAQDAVFKTKFGQYVQQYGPEGAARAWFGGPKGMNNPNAADVNGMTVGQYGKNFTRLASNAPGLPQGARMPEGINAPPPVVGSPQAPASPAGGMLMAQAPGATQMAANRGGAPIVGTPAGPIGTQGGQPIGPVPLIPRVSRKQYLTGQMLGSPENQALWSSMYYGQNQPIQAQGFGGHWVLDPRGQQPPRFIPDIQKMEAGGATIPYTFNERGEMVPPRQAPVLGGPQGGGPLAAPPPNTTLPTAPPSMSPSVAPPASAPGAVPGPSGAVQTAMPKLAALETGTMNDAGPLGTRPPGAFGAVPVPPIEKPAEAAAAEAAPAGVQTAQSMLPPMLRDTLLDVGNVNAENKRKETAATKDVELFNDEYKDFRDKSTAAVAALPQIQYARKIIEQPGIVQGPFADFKVGWNKLLTTLGDKDAEQNLSYNQIFEKLISNGILRDMKTMLGGWAGQVRNAEIALMNKASATQYNTIEANRAILDMAERSQKQLAEVGQRSNWYRQGYQFDNKGELTLDANGHPIMGPKAPDAAGLDNVIRGYLTNNPIYNPNELEHINDILDAGKVAPKGGPLSTPAPGTPGKAPPPPAGYR
jgi:hypothetical protein